MVPNLCGARRCRDWACCFSQRQSVLTSFFWPGSRNSSENGNHPRDATVLECDNAQSNAPYYEAAGINVTDQAGYEASGVVELRDKGEWR